MATITMIDKQIQSREKAIAQKRATMAKREQTIAKGMAVLHKAGFTDLTATIVGESNPYTLTSQLHIEHSPLYDKLFSIHYAVDMQFNAAKEIQYLERELQELQARKKAAEAHAETAANAYDNNLEEVFTNAFSVFHEAYIKKMVDYYTNLYTYYHEHRKEWMKKLDEVMTERERIGTINYFDRETRAKVHALIGQRSELQKLLAHESLRYENVQTYINDFIMPELEVYWKFSIRKLTDKCSKMNINKSALKVTEPECTGKGFEVVVTDGTSRRIYARLIWAAENSLLVTPHFRYIVTERG